MHAYVYECECIWFRVQYSRVNYVSSPNVGSELMSHLRLTWY